MAPPTGGDQKLDRFSVDLVACAKPKGVDATPNSGWADMFWGL
jgi:hypothetical protein